jgi:hypothetical protein
MKMRSIAAVAISVSFLSGCAMAPFQPGTLFSSQKLPVDAPNNAVSCEKKGTGTSTNVLGLFRIW